MWWHVSKCSWWLRYLTLKPVGMLQDSAQFNTQPETFCLRQAVVYQRSSVDRVYLRYIWSIQCGVSEICTVLQGRVMHMNSGFRLQCIQRTKDINIWWKLKIQNSVFSSRNPVIIPRPMNWGLKVKDWTELRTLIITLIKATAIICSFPAVDKLSKQSGTTGQEAKTRNTCVQDMRKTSSCFSFC